MRAPPPLPPPKRGQYDAGDCADFLGAFDPLLNFNKLIIDYKKYVSKWSEIPMSIGKFWRDPSVLAIFGESRVLVNVALWYSTRATSSVSIERVFGIMRHMEGDTNRRLSDESIDTEMLARSNGWIVDRLLARLSAMRKIGH